ncbi:MAG: MMPL family transporter [Magnetococcales bacterium]|nr:MMPL family transporter [Magnetococcales bacterium]
MEKIIRFSSHHSTAIFIVLFLCTLFAGTTIKDLKIDISAQDMMVKDSVELAFYQQTLDRFGSDSITILYLHDQHLFSADRLKAIQKAIETIESSPYVKETNSLFSIPHLKSINGNLSAKPYLAEIPTQESQVEQIKEAALKNPLIQNNLLSKDGKSMAVNIIMDTNALHIGYEEKLVSDIEKAISPLREKLETVFQIGNPSVTKLLNEKIRQEQTTILPLSLIMLFLTLLVSQRRLTTAFLPLMTALLSIIWTLGLMAAFDIPITVITSIVPALLIIVGSTEDIHILAEYHAGIELGLDKRKSIDRMGKRIGLAILLTFITSYLGFLSIILNNIQLLQEFGLIASTGLLFNFFITVLLIPATLSQIGSQSQQQKIHKSESSRTERLLCDWISKSGFTLPLAIFVITLTIGTGAFQLRINNSAMDYFDSQSTIKLQADRLTEDLAGMQTFSIVLNAGIRDTFLKAHYLNQIQSLQQAVDKTGHFDKTFSFADVMALLNVVMEESPEELMLLPDSDDLVREYMLFLDHEQVKTFISEDFSTARIIVRHAIQDTHMLNLALRDIEGLIKNVDPGLAVKITGEGVLNSRAADAMAIGQAKSVLLMLFIIFIIISLLFLNYRAGLSAIIANLFPIILLFGVMGFMGIPLNTGTAMVAVIAIGICVDNTIHFMVRYNTHLRTHHHEQEALRRTIRDESSPIFATSISLAIGFGTFALSSFPPLVWFGLLSSMVMLLALFSTFIITPMLLLNIHLLSVWEMLSVRLKTRVLEQCELFFGMRRWHIKKVIVMSRVKTCKPGEIIFISGDMATDMFVILSGSVEMKVVNNQSRATIRQLKEGELFGIQSVVTGVKRTSEAFTTEETQLLVINWKSIQNIARFQPRLSAKIFFNLSRAIGHRLILADQHNLQLSEELRSCFNMRAHSLTKQE